MNPGRDATPHFLMEVSMSDSDTTPAMGAVIKVKKKSRLQLVADELAMTVDEMLDRYGTDSIVPGICMRCELVHDACEPDGEDNWCDACDAGTVKSILVLAGVI